MQSSSTTTCSILGILARVQDLLAQGVNPNAQDGVGNIPLMWAAGGGREEVVALLLGQPNINLEARDVSGRTALLVAARNGHLSVVKLLLHHGADPTA